MKALVVFDSVHRNTEVIALVIANSLEGEVEVDLRWVGGVILSKLNEVDLLIVGSPTHRGRPTLAIQGLLQIGVHTLEGTKVATFDTRLATKLVSIFGYAAGKIAKKLEAKGGTLVVPPEGFIVEGTEGPLREGEVERAAAWAQKVLKSAG